MDKDAMTTSEALVWAFGELSRGGMPSARDEAEFIMMHVLGCKRSELFLNARRVLAAPEEALLRSAVARRMKREPSQYIFGEAEFRGRAFRVTPDVLIPRPETELMVDEALREAKGLSSGGLKVVDLCTGSGCIGVSVALEIEGCEVVAADISEKALAVARGNALSLGAGRNISFLQGDLFEALPDGLRGQVDMVLTNPPYISDEEMTSLAPEVREHEPLEALRGGADGLDMVRRILSQAPKYLRPGGLLLMEMGYGQDDSVARLAGSSGAWGTVDIIKDYAGIGRILKARSLA